MPLEPYDEKEELAAVQRRYDINLKAVPVTLRRLQNDAEFMNVVAELRSQNWKDWHFLLAIFNGVANWRLNQIGAMEDDGEARRVVTHLTENGEAESDELVPLDEFTKENLVLWLQGAMVSGLFSYKDAVPRRRPYKHAKLAEIVAQRYHYFELDVEHAPIFE